MDASQVACDRNKDPPRLLASTGSSNQQLQKPPFKQGRNFVAGEPTQFFKSFQWSPDGTTILASLSTNSLVTYVPPPNLLSPPSGDTDYHDLNPYSVHHVPEPSYATLIHPAHDLQDPSTCLALASVRDLPLRLFSTLYNPTLNSGHVDGGGSADGDGTASAVLASYPLVSPTTEAYLGIHSLAFGSSNWLYAGSEGLIAAFDLSRPGEGPVETLRTGKGRGRARGAGRHAIPGGLGDVMGIKGIVSALGISSEGLMAAGTYKRDVGLYDGFRSDGTIATFSLVGEVDGSGITQVLWSDCGRYLCVAERGSVGVGVWDIRGSGKRLAWLEGRAAQTQQRLNVEVKGKEVWAGTTDGHVNVWGGLGAVEGDVSPIGKFQAHDDAVAGAGLHPYGGILATCSGQRHLLDVANEARDVASMAGSPPTEQVGMKGNMETLDSSLKIWAV